MGEFLFDIFSEVPSLLLFAAHHSVCARESVKQALARVFPERLLRSIYVWVASLLLLAVYVWWQPVLGLLYRVDGVGSLVLRLAQCAGLGLTISAATAMRPLELSGITPPRTDEPLVVRGTYGLVRHPLHLGWVLMVFGTPAMTGDRFVFAALTTCYLIVALRWEERALEQTFGAAYADYVARVRWRIVPYLY